MWLEIICKFKLFEMKAKLKFKLHGFLVWKFLFFQTVKLSKI